MINLGEKIAWGSDSGIMDAAATMLRQQALEIQALHQILGYEGIEVGREYLDECVSELRKQLNEQ